MKVYLKNMDKEDIVDSINDFSRNIILKATDILIKENLAIETKDMSTYKGNKCVGWWSSSKDRKELAECYKKDQDKNGHLIKWYFNREIKNVCSMIKRGDVN